MKTVVPFRQKQKRWLRWGRSEAELGDSDSDHRIIEWLVVEEVWHNPCPNRDSRTGCPVPHTGSFWRSQRRKLHSLWAACAPSTAQHRSATWCSESTACVAICAHWLFSWHWTPLIKDWLCPLCTIPMGTYRHWWNPLHTPLIQAKQFQFSQTFLTGKMLLFLHHLHGPSLDSLQ